jgi:sugar phosphate permease
MGMSIENKLSVSPSKVSQKALLIWACGGFFYFYQFILRVSPSVMTEDLMKAFAVQGCTLGILTAFYYNAYASLQIPLGMLLDRFGPRRLLTFSCFLCTLGCVLFASSNYLSIASLGRLLMGAGSACAFIGTIKLATMWFPLERIGKVVGFTMLLGTLGATFAGAPLAALVELVGWRQSLFIISILGAVLCVVIWSFVRDRVQPSEELEKTRAPRILQGFITVITNRQVWLLALYGSLMYVPLSAFADLWGVSYIIQLYGVDRKIAGSLVSMIYVGVAVGAPLAAFFSDYLKKRQLPMMIGAAFSLMLYGIIVYYPAIPLELMYVLLFLTGLSFAPQMLCFASVCEQIPLAASGVAVGFTNMIVMASGVIFEPLVGFLLEHSAKGAVVGGVPLYTVEDFRFSLATIPLSILGAFALTFFIQETYPTRKKAKAS